MVHLSNPKTISAMVFYSILTFFIGPLVTRPFIGKSQNPNDCIYGFFLGFVVSVILWMNYSKQLLK